VKTPGFENFYGDCLVMDQYLKSLLFFGVLLLSACQAGNATQDITSSAEGLATPVVPEVTNTSPRPIIPTTIQGTSTSFPETHLPTLLYIHGNKLMEQVGDHAPKEITELPNAGKVISAIKTKNMIIVLRQQGIQRLKLDGGRADMVYRFDEPALFGDLIAAADGSKIFFSVTASDAKAPFSMATQVGSYDPVQEVVIPILYVLQDMRILGSTSDGLGLYLLPVGQDPDFGEVLRFDLQRNEMSEELPIRGTEYASLAPDASLLAVAAFTSTVGDRLEPMLKLYDLRTSPLAPPRAFALPDSSSQVAGFVWTPDGRELYFLFLPRDITDQLEAANGFWRLIVETGEMSQVVSVTDPGFHIADIDPGGKWVLIKHESKDQAILVSLPDGESQFITVPPQAVFMSGH
jgi:hypothetical protein